MISCIREKDRYTDTKCDDKEVMQFILNYPLLSLITGMLGQGEIRI